MKQITSIMKNIGLLFASCVCFNFTNLYADDEFLKILAVGNSFSEDAAEAYLDDLARADGVKLTIGIMYIGGSTMEDHWNNASNDRANYSYRKIIDGDTTVTAAKTLSLAAIDEDWDYIVLQQRGIHAGDPDSYFPYFTDLIDYFKERATNDEVKFAYFQTWAYANGTTYPNFSDYYTSQEEMYDDVIQGVNAACTRAGIELIIPCGTAIQNARTSCVGDNLCGGDGYHLNNGIGRYTAACTWYEKLTGNPVTGNSFIPHGMTQTSVFIAQHAAHNAILNPNDITSLIDLTEDIVEQKAEDFENDFVGAWGVNGNDGTSTPKEDHESFKIADNPFKTSVNNSDKVAVFNRKKSGSWWAYAWFYFDPVFVGNTPKYLHVMVNKPIASNICIQLKDKHSGNLIANSGEITSNAQTKTNEWQDVVFRINKAGDYSYLEFKPDFVNATPSSRLTDDIDIYFDDIVINNDPTPRSTISITKNQLIVSSDIQIFPTITSGIVTITNTGTAPVKISVCDLNGSIVNEETLLGPNLQVNISAFAAGLYVLNISNREMNRNFKIIKI